MKHTLKQEQQSPLWLPETGVPYVVIYNSFDGHRYKKIAKILNTSSNLSEYESSFIRAIYASIIVINKHWNSMETYA